MVRTSPSNARDSGSIHGWGTMISRASWPKSKIKIKQGRSNMVTNSIKSLKMIPVIKKKIFFSVSTLSIMCKGQIC